MTYPEVPWEGRKKLWEMDSGVAANRRPGKVGQIHLRNTTLSAIPRDEKPGDV